MSCTVNFVPFNCRKKTCECHQPGNLSPLVSENCLIRYDARPPVDGPDHLRLIYRSSQECGGMLDVYRDEDVPLLEFPTECRRGLQCVDVAVGDVSRRPIRLENGEGAMTPEEAFLRLQAAGSPHNSIPDVRPYTNREMLRVFVSCCNNACNDQTSVTVWDCDLMLLAYQMLYVTGITYTSALRGIDTVRQFFARMAIRGVKELCDEYHRSATSCERRIQDVNAAACISAVLAEETWSAQMAQVRGQPLSPAWTAYYDAPNLHMDQLDLFTFRRYAGLFGDAHLTEGLAKALAAAGGSPCRAHDLNVIVEVLAGAQAVAVTEAVGALTLGMLGTSVGQEFRREMRGRVLSALEQTGDAATADALRQQWQ